MKNNIELTSLQQARKKTGLSLSEMAELLITDVSNLSKYERGIRTPSSNIVLDYHLLTGEPLEKLFRAQIKQNLKFLSYQLEQKIKKLKEGIRNVKVDNIIPSLMKCIERVNCLHDQSEKSHD